MDSMSWSDDTRCLYCDGKLPLYRKLTNGQFCSTGHQKAYWKEQERLAVEVLHRTHDALMAFRPAQDIELIIGPAVGWNGQSPDAPPAQAPPAQEPARREPVAPRVERPAEPVRPTEPVYASARPIAQAPPAAQSPLAPEPAPPSFADFIQGSPDGLSPSWAVLPLMQAVEPVQEEPAFLDLLIRDSGQLTVLAVVLDGHGVEEQVEIPIYATEPAPVASRLEHTSRLEQTEDALLALAENVGSIQPVIEPEPAHALHQETALHPLVPEVKLHRATLKPAAFDRVPEPVTFVQPAAVAVAEPAVVIERGVLERLAVPESDRVFLQRETSMVAMGPDAEVAPVAEAAATTPVSESLLVTEVIEQAAVNPVAEQPIPPLAGWQHYEASFAAVWSDTASLVVRESSPEIPSDFSSRMPAMLETPALAPSAFEPFPSDLEQSAEDRAPVPPLAGWQHHETSFAAAWSDTASLVASECSPELLTDFTLRMPQMLEKPALAVSALEPFSAAPEQSVEDSGPVPPMAGEQHYEASFAAAWSDTASLVASDASSEFSMSQMLEKPALAAASAFEPFSAKLEQSVELTLDAAEIAPQPRLAALTWFRLGAFNPPLLVASSLTGFEPHVRLAGGCRYAMNGLSPAPPANPSCEAVGMAAERKAIEYPHLAASDWQAGMQTNCAPDFAALDSLSAWKAEMSAHAIPRTKVRKSATEPVAPSSAIWIPALRLQPLRWVSSQPLAPMPVEEAPKPPAAAAPEFPAPPKEHPQIGHLLVGFWKNAPRDLRLLVFAIPALLALAFHPSLPKVHVSTVQATEPVEKNVGQAVNGSWNSFKQVVSERAAVQLDEDFRTGLDDWSSPGGTATEWSFDANGFVRPGSLALYSPSLSLADYEAQFLAIIDQKALSWVVRAEDFSNYYVIKLVVVKPGPLTTLGLTRYAVINGKPQNRVDAVVPFTARPDMIYRVRMDIHDDSYVLAIQGQMVDAWSEPMS